MRFVSTLFALLVSACGHEAVDASFCAAIYVPPDEYSEAFAMFDAFSDSNGWERLTIDPGVHEYGDKSRDFDAALVVGMGEIGAVADFYDFGPNLNDEQLESFKSFIAGPVSRRWTTKPCNQIQNFEPPRMQK